MGILPIQENNRISNQNRVKKISKVLNLDEEIIKLLKLMGKKYEKCDVWINSEES